jgi:aminopeptidase N
MMSALVRRLTIACLLIVIATPSSGQRLPEGRLNLVRERTYDIIHFRADLELDYQIGAVAGTATIELEPLQPITVVSLDAIGLDVKRVSMGGTELGFSAGKRWLEVRLPAVIQPGRRFVLAVQYRAVPESGMYFQPDSSHDGHYFVHTYGEGGVLANWLPIYSGENDKFSTEMVVTVPPPYVAVSNGALVEVIDRPDGSRTFHWRQRLPHSNYLISLYVGDFEQGELAPAMGSIPVGYWVPRGRLSEGAYAFRNTTRMVEFFSNLLGYPYPWDKYDQIAVPDYAIGAMEHTGVTGHSASVLRQGASAPIDFGSPDFDEYATNWSAEGTIAHELAHHWFGDNTTCRGLSYLWLNESFATYLQMLWDEESVGRDQLLFDVHAARNSYLDYVREKHVIRPLEYAYFDGPETIYNEEHTYFKGAVVLHMLRAVLGDSAFFASLSRFQHDHELANVDSHDFRRTLEEVSGRNLGWFFDDWVTGGGHPVLEVKSRYLTDRRLVDLKIAQIQPVVKGQGLFRLPVTVTLATADATWRQNVWLEDHEDSFLLPSPVEPLMVSVDGAGDLMAEIRFDKPPEKLAYQATHDALIGRLRAFDQLAQRWPERPETVRVLDRALKEDGFWALQAEAAELLGQVRTQEAEELLAVALGSDDYRVRKAAVLGLARFFTPSATAMIRRVIDNDSHSDVVGTGIVALARVAPEDAIALIPGQLERASWYDEIRIACVTGLKELARPELVPLLEPYVDARYNQALRQVALEAWAASEPRDPKLHRALVDAAQGPPYALRKSAVKMLGRLYVKDAIPLLEGFVERDFDRDITVLARRALEEIRRVQGTGVGDTTARNEVR